MGAFNGPGPFFVVAVRLKGGHAGDWELAGPFEGAGAQMKEREKK